ncbi:MAG: hypothetical protein LBP73_07960 [Clostridiales Family XIII bacterium]|jgi:nitrogenase molybdenum-iron protein beta chain|nr:hypothetical protein [Clostridiales Family XIII bacterium]
MDAFIERPKFTCALGGAIAAINALPRSVSIVHASGGCGSSLSGVYNSAAGYFGSGYCSGNMESTSNIAEKEIIFGGEDKLLDEIRTSIEIIDADLYFVLSGCQVEMIGEDTVGTAKRFQGGDVRVLAANTPGFAGNSYHGYDTVMAEIAKSLVKRKDKKRTNVVNILGIVPGQDVFYKGNLREIKRILFALGLKANTFFGENETVEDIENSGDAALNLVFSEFYGVKAAKTFEEVHGIPYIQTDLPIGDTATERFIRLVAGALHINQNKVRRLIASEKKYYYSYVERMLDIYADIDLQRYLIAVLDSSYAYPIMQFLSDDVGWIAHLAIVNDIEDGAQQLRYAEKFKTLESSSRPAVVFEPHTGQVRKHITDSWPRNRNDRYYDALGPSFVIGSSLEGSTAASLNAGFLPIAFPLTSRLVLNKGYTGYHGALALLEDIFSVLVAGR